MRILIASYYYLPHVGGGTWYVFHVSRHLAERGHEVTLAAPRIAVGLTPTDSVDDPPANVGFVRLNRTPLPGWFAGLAGLLLFRPRVLRMARSSDVLVGQYHPHHTIPFAAVLVGKLVGRPVVLRVEDWRRWMFGDRPSLRARFEYRLASPVNALNEWAARTADMLIVVNSIAVEYFASKNVGRRALELSENGVDLEAIRHLPDRTALRRQLGIPAGANVVTFVGRYSGPEYRVDALLLAFQKVLREMPEAVLILVGDELSDPLRSTYEDLLLQGVLRLVGPVTQASALAYTKLADVAVGPLGPTATTPLKILEALACGTAVVTGDGSVGPELAPFASMIDRVRPDPETVAEALLKRLNAPRPRTPDALQRLLSTFDWHDITSRLESNLQRVARKTAIPRVAGPSDKPLR